MGGEKEASKKPRGIQYPRICTPVESFDKASDRDRYEVGNYETPAENGSDMHPSVPKRSLVCLVHLSRITSVITEPRVMLKLSERIK